MKKYIIDGIESDRIPDPCHGCSPVTEEVFAALGGVIEDDGRPTPKESVIASLNTLLRELAGRVDGITVAEFKQAALSMHSGDLIAYARRMNVPDEVIAEGRSRVVEILADAMREGMSWTELVEGIRP